MTAIKKASVVGAAVAMLAIAIVARRTSHEAAKRPATRVSAPSSLAVARVAQPAWENEPDPEGELRLEGRVVDQSGAGVPATVWLDSDPPKSTATEDDGSFAFDRVVGREYRLSAVAGTQTGGPVAYRLTADSDPVVIQLVAGARVVVTVTNESGTAISGASVRVDDVSATAADTDASGTVTLSPVRPGLVGVAVTAAGYADAHAVAQLGSPGAVASLAVTLRKGVAVSGRVVDEAGNGIANVEVAAGESWWWMPTSAGRTTTDARGEFRFGAVASGTHVLVATDGVHAPGRSAPIAVVDRAVSGVAILMKEGGVVSGRVVDAGGASVPFATVRVAQKGSEVAGRQAIADKGGLFELRGLPRTALQVRAIAEAASSKVVELDVAQRAVARDVQLVVDQTGAIAGVVVDDKGQPLPEIQVTAGGDVLSNERPALAGISSATSNGAGEFTIRGLAPGAYRLRAVRPGGSALDLGSPGVPASAGDRNVKVTLPAAATLVGKVVLASGQPPSFATVQVGHHAATPVARDGSIRVDELSPGNYDVRILGAGFAEVWKRDVKLESGKETDLGTVTLARGRMLVGRVVDAKGAPVGGARVTVSQTLVSMEGAEDQMRDLAERSGAKMSTTDADGSFSIVGIPSTPSYAAAAHLERGRSDAIEIVAGTDDPPAVTLALRAFGSIRGKVTSNGAPVGGATITDRVQGSTAQVQMARSADDGTFVLEHAAEGTHVLNATQTQGMSALSSSATVVVAAGAAATANIDIPVGSVELTVQIDPIAGSKVDAAQVFVFRGALAATTGKQVSEAVAAGRMQSMKFWFGAGKPMPSFEQLVATDYTVCGVPITGDLADATFQQRLRQNLDTLAVVCRPVTLRAVQTKQTLALPLPTMTPFPGG